MTDSPRFNQETFQAWRDSRTNRPFLQFLTDQRDRLAEQWAAGQEMDSRHQTKALLLGEFRSLEWADVAAFYDIETEAEA